MQYALYVAYSTSLLPRNIYHSHHQYKHPTSSNSPYANFHIKNFTRPSRQLGPTILVMAHDIRTRLLRRRNDASINTPVRSRSVGNHLPRLTAAIRRDDRRGHINQ